MKHRLIFEWESETTIEEGDTRKIQTNLVAEYLKGLKDCLEAYISDLVDEQIDLRSSYLVIENVKEKVNGSNDQS